MPFVAPKKYFDLYPLESIPSVNNPVFPKGAPKFAGLNSNEMQVYYGIPKRGRIADEEKARKLYRAYYACVSYVDAQVGRLLAELDRLKLRDNTVVILWGDHGYLLRASTPESIRRDFAQVSVKQMRDSEINWR